MTHEFDYSLQLKLALEADGKTVELLAGNIEKVDLELHSYGFKSTIRFSGCNNEELETLFNAEKVIKATLTFLPTDPAKTEPFLELKGIVIERRSQRVDEVDHNKDEPLSFYNIVIYDNARATWEDHFPENIYVNKSMKEALEDHKNPEVSIKYDFPPLEEKKPIIAFSLNFNKSLPKTEQVHFYSFLTWYLHQEGGIFAYDYQAHSYSILTKKEAGKGDPYKVREKWVDPPDGLHAPVPRFNTKILTPTPNAIEAEDQENENAFKSVRRDFMNPKDYVNYPERAPEEVKSPLEPTLTELTIHIRRFVEDFHIDKLIPGLPITFLTEKQSWTEAHKDKVYRTRFLILTFEKSDHPDANKPIQDYRLSAKAVLELKDEVFVERPTFYPPTFPFEMPGKVFSDIGDEKQSTYKVLETEDAPQGQYLVLVPMAGKDEKVPVPFTPNLTGQHFSPYTKDQDVLLAMYFHTAHILRAISLLDHVRQPKGVQVNQTVLASNGKNEYALIKHEYKDGNKSVVSIEQSTSDKQTQTFTVQDKEILIVVETKDEKTVFIRYNSEKGLFLSLNDKASKITQEIALDGKQITQTCKNDSDTSTIVQTPDSTTFTCKNFNVKADNVKVEAADAISFKAGSKCNIEAPVTNAKTELIVSK